MGFLHIECMKHWLNTKRTVKDYNDNTCIIYTWKIVSCELCKQPYPHTIHFKDKSVCILEYDEPKDEPYIIFESYPKEGSKNETQKSIYVCKMRDKKLIRMGRAQQNELRIHDISISRNHAEIAIKDGKMFIRDNKSKFGTLILMKSPEDIPTAPDTIFSYQIGRTVLVFNTQKKKSLCSSFCMKWSKSKTGETELKKNKRKELYKDDAEIVDSQEAGLIIELEIEKLQKNNDSEFYLDDEFYDRMANEYVEKQNPQRKPIDLSAIKFDDSVKDKTEDEEELQDDEDGYNPLAMTSDGKKGNKLTQELMRLAAERNEVLQDTPNSKEESKNLEVPRIKKLDNSISDNELEIRIDSNAPSVR